MQQVAVFSPVKTSRNNSSGLSPKEIDFIVLNQKKLTVYWHKINYQKK